MICGGLPETETLKESVDISLRVYDNRKSQPG